MFKGLLKYPVIGIENLIDRYKYGGGNAASYPMLKTVLVFQRQPTAPRHSEQADALKTEIVPQIVYVLNHCIGVVVC